MAALRAALPAGAIADAARTVATLATGDAEIGAMLARSGARVGAEGVILVEAGHGRASELEVREGMHYDKGYVSARFVTDRRLRPWSSWRSPYILLHLAGSPISAPSCRS